MRYWPLILQDLKRFKNPYILLEIFFYPLITISMFGFFIKYVDADLAIRTFLFSGSIGWVIIQTSQHAIGRGFLAEVWDGSLKQTFTAPITLRDFVLGHWMYGIFAATIGVLVSSIAVYFLFGFNFFVLGVYFPLVILLGSFAGLALGIVALSIVLLLGLKVDVIIWMAVEIALFLSGVYYSVTIFPEPIQSISRAFPAIYMFDGTRAVLNGLEPNQIFLNGFLVSLVWIIISLASINKIDEYAKRSGFYQRYG